MATTAERLAEVQAAISAIATGGQEYQIGTRKVRRADLAQLQELERQLQNELASETSSTRVYAKWGGNR